MNHSIRMKSQNRFQYRTLRTVYFSHSCDSIVNFGNGWNTVQVSSDGSVWNGIAQFKCSRNRSICAVSFTTMHLFVCVWILFVLLWIRLVHALLFFRVRVFSHWNFVCLLSCHFSCASRSFTPINLFFSSTSHTLCTWLFSIYLCCASCFCCFVRREFGPKLQCNAKRWERMSMCVSCFDLWIFFVWIVFLTFPKPNYPEWSFIFTACNAMSYNILSFVLMANLF